MPSDHVHNGSVPVEPKHLIGFTDQDAIQVLPPGTYEGYVVPSAYYLGENGSDKKWYTVRIISDDPTLDGKQVNVGIVQANVRLETSVWVEDDTDAD